MTYSNIKVIPYNFKGLSHTHITIFDDIWNVEILSQKLVEKVGQKQANLILNNRMFKKRLSALDRLEIVKGPNLLINIQESEHAIRIIKRSYSNGNYSEFIFEYDLDKNKSHIFYKPVKEQELVEISDYNTIEDELDLLFKEINIIPYGINLITNKLCLLDGFPGHLEMQGEEISLYSSRDLEDKINDIEIQKFYIVENDTEEVVGYVKFDFSVENIAYKIYEDYRGNHYAAKALRMLIELIKENVNFLEYNLYVRIFNDNEASLKTAEVCELPVFEKTNHVTSYLVNPKLMLTNSNN